MFVCVWGGGCMLIIESLVDLFTHRWVYYTYTRHTHRNRQGGAAEAGDGMEEEGPFFDLILSAETFYTADVTDKVLFLICLCICDGSVGGCFGSFVVMDSVQVLGLSFSFLMPHP